MRDKGRCHEKEKHRMVANGSSNGLDGKRLVGEEEKENEVTEQITKGKDSRRVQCQPGERPRSVMPPVGHI